MTSSRQYFFLGVLVLLGAGWGATQPLAKIAVSTGYGHFGLMFWQTAIGSAFMWVLVLLRRRPIVFNTKALIFCFFIAMIGTAVPNTTQFIAVKHLPSGIMSILLSLIPMMAFPFSLALGLERFSPRRFLGLTFGLFGVLILVVPDASLPDPAMLVWVPLALVAPALYAFEGNFVAKWGTGGLDPIPLLAGATLITAILMAPAAIATGQFITPFQPFGAPEWSIVASAVINVTVYASYVWLVGQAGPVFSAQVSYLVTGFGVFWAMLVLGERYSPYVWIALAMVLCGIALVQPRKNAAFADAPVME